MPRKFDVCVECGGEPQEILARNRCAKCYRRWERSRADLLISGDSRDKSVEKRQIKLRHFVNGVFKLLLGVRGIITDEDYSVYQATTNKYEAQLVRAVSEQTEPEQAGKPIEPEISTAIESVTAPVLDPEPPKTVITEENVVWLRGYLSNCLLNDDERAKLQAALDEYDKGKATSA
jgi:hypothetical protein